jgi:hypothetical protein
MVVDAPTVSVNTTPSEEEGVDGGRAGSKTGRGAALSFSRECSIGRECLICAFRMSGRENGGVPALLGSARSITGNARLRGMQIVSIAGSRSGANADLIPGHRDSWERVL